MSPSRSKTMVFASLETSSDIHVPSSVVNSIFLSVLSGSSSSFFLSSFFSSSFFGSWASAPKGRDTRRTMSKDRTTRTRLKAIMAILRKSKLAFHWARENIKQIRAPRYLDTPRPPNLAVVMLGFNDDVDAVSNLRRRVRNAQWSVLELRLCACPEHAERRGSW